jgi:OOP family OmpA-OmpF porin
MTEWRNLMKRLAFAMCLVWGSTVAQAADIPGSKDPSYFKRYQGSEIISYVTRSYDEYTLARGPGAPSVGFSKLEKVEGAVTRIIYRVPAGHTALELLRNYEKMLSDAGFTQNFELAPCGGLTWDQYFFGKFYNQNQAGRDNDPYPFVNKSSCYFTAKATKDKQDTNVAVLISESTGGNWRRPDQKDPIVIKPGEILVAVDVIVGTAVENKMIQPKAEEMSKALAQAGKVDIYGILFDVDKTDVKPQSKPTLDEVAKLLKSDSTLNLEVAGHTDNTGGADHNMKLSQGRATAVVQGLVKDYGINSARLQAKGYGDTKPVAPNETEDGRAKNRRVELRKL